ncbi:DNA polymerase III subunit gamma and tau [Zhihengliuella halotolerans]|uniref:DNA polymerase III subunit gamma/tau n=1 Tax=Zhihengliuella halotolerans TaxID=370736 RepID=A0A4Q8AIH6_9MICC|nr:DNA polymerase III subunit gamma and tau [Zhihengliuella halotolerans]RZU63623.1 DNA polymerase-3 subunit gamma/tau [Zhihengliuella halotolerans]
MSTALYRRYRPDSFADVIGQEHVTTPLMAALEKNRVNHAYLFSGPRGCGKTTSARILARCLNCEQGPTPNPCGTCASCVDLATGGPGSLDVIEIDAASHGGVDDARDLRERATFAPTRDRYKIFIIDEAHMVTSAGFNALLKIVEEPPEHIKFIFATTEPDKVIGTIRSRTHHYPFRLVPPETLIEYLERLCQQEGVPVAPGVLSLVLRAGGGSVRDTLSVLDQLMAGAGAEGLNYELAVSLLGYTHATLLDDVVDALAAQDAATVFGVVDRVIQTGHDPRRFVEDLLERLRDLIIVKAMPDSAAQIIRGLPADQLARMQQQAALLGQAELSRSADVANQALTEMTGATSPRLHLELLCARLLLPASDTTERGIGARVDRIERRLTYGGDAPLADGSSPAQHDAAPGGDPAADTGVGGFDANGASGAAAVREALRKARQSETDAQPEPAGQQAQPAETQPQPQPAEPQPIQPSQAAPVDEPAQAPAPRSGPGTEVPAPESTQDETPVAPTQDSAAENDAAAEQPAASAPKDGPAFPKTAAELAARLPAAAPKPATSREDATADWGGTFTVPDPDRSGTGQRGAPATPPAATAPSDRPEQAQAPSAGQPTGPAAPTPAQAPAAGENQPSPGAEPTTPAAPRDQSNQAQPAAPRPTEPQQQPRSAQPQPTDPQQQPQPAQEQPTEPQPPASQPQPAGPSAAPETRGGAGSIEMFRRAWPEILDVVKGERKAVWMNLQQNATLAGFDGKSLAVSFSNPGARTNFLSRPDNPALLQWAINQILGMQINVDIVAGGSAPAGGSGPKVDRRPEPASAGPAPVAPQQAPGPFNPAPQRQEHYERPAAPEWTEFPPVDAAGTKPAKPVEKPAAAPAPAPAKVAAPEDDAMPAEDSAPQAVSPVAEPSTAPGSIAPAPARPVFTGDRGSAVSPVEAAGPRGHSSRSAVSAASAHSAHSTASASSAASAPSADSAASPASAPSAASAAEAEPTAPEPAPAPAGASAPPRASEWGDQHWDEPDDGWMPPEEEPPPYDDLGPEPDREPAAKNGPAPHSDAPAPRPAPAIPPAPAGPTPPPPSWAGTGLPATMRPDPAAERPAAPAPERRDPARKLSRYQQLLAQAQADGTAPGMPPGASAPTPHTNAGPGAPGAGTPSSYSQGGPAAAQNPIRGGQPVNSSYGATPDADFVPSDDDIAIEDSTVIGRAAIERILNGRLIDERNNDGTPIS